MRQVVQSWITQNTSTFKAICFSRDVFRRNPKDPFRIVIVREGEAPGLNPV